MKKEEKAETLMLKWLSVALTSGLIRMALSLSLSLSDIYFT